MNYIQPDWPASKRIKAYTTVRHSWGKWQPGQEQQKNHAIMTLLNLPAPPIWLSQIHSTTAVEAIPENKGKQADASFTQQSDQVCTVLTADCLPLLICNQQATQVAAIHAGWRGLAKGIIESTLAAMQTNPGDLLVWLGPAIGPQKFEVGVDVYQAFTESHAAAAHAFTPYGENKWLANLYALAKLRLNLLGVKQIYGGQFCTYSQEDLFFSYRREGSETGRMASLIWIDGKISATHK